MSNDTLLQSRRNALKCLAYGSAGTLFTLAGGVLSPIDLAVAGTDKMSMASAGTPLFVQISDTHIGFSKEANPDVNLDIGESVHVDAWNADGTATVRYRGAQWTVVSRAGSTLSPGEYKVAEVVGSRLVVEKI